MYFDKDNHKLFTIIREVGGHAYETMVEDTESLGERILGFLVLGILVICLLPFDIVFLPVSFLFSFKFGDMPHEMEREIQEKREVKEIVKKQIKEWKASQSVTKTVHSIVEELKKFNKIIKGG